MKQDGLAVRRPVRSHCERTAGVHPLLGTGSRAAFHHHLARISSIGRVENHAVVWRPDRPPLVHGIESETRGCPSRQIVDPEIIVTSSRLRNCHSDTASIVRKGQTLIVALFSNRSSGFSMLIEPYELRHIDAQTSLICQNAVVRDRKESVPSSAVAENFCDRHCIAPHRE